MAQMYPVGHNIIYQDSASSVLLEKNSKSSSGKRMRHLAIQYFFITNCVSMGEVEVIWIPWDQMIADYLTKALQGREFCEFQYLFMGAV